MCCLRVILFLPGDTPRKPRPPAPHARSVGCATPGATHLPSPLSARCLSTKLVLLAPSCALARRRRGSGAVSVRARGAPQSSRHLPAEGQRPRVDRGRGSTAGSVSARAWRPDRPGGSGWMRRRRTSAARPHDSSRAHARPLCSQPTSPGRSARAGAWGGCGPRLVERAAEPEV